MKLHDIILEEKIFVVSKDDKEVARFKTAIQAARSINKYTDKSFGKIGTEDIRVAAKKLRNNKPVKINVVKIEIQ